MRIIFVRQNVVSVVEYWTTNEATLTTFTSRPRRNHENISHELLLLNHEYFDPENHPLWYHVTKTSLGKEYATPIDCAQDADCVTNNSLL